MRKTLMVLVLALALAGCGTTQKQNIGKYPDEAKENFTDTCTESAQRARPGDVKAIQESCKCIIEKLEDSVPYKQQGANNDFTDADALVRDGKPLTGDLQTDFDKATADCAQDR